MTDDTRKADVKNWRRGYEAALAGKAFLRVEGQGTSAWRLGYRDGRALRLKLHVQAKPPHGWPIDQRYRDRGDRWCGHHPCSWTERAEVLVAEADCEALAPGAHET